MSILSHVIRNKGAKSWKTNRKCFVKRKKNYIIKHGNRKHMKFLWVLNDKNEKLHSIFCSSRLPVLAMKTHKITRQLNEWIDPSQTYQILKHYYQYLPHTSNPNQIPRRYQRKLPTNLSLWTATCWRGSICCTAVTQTKSRDMSVRDLRRLDTEALPKMSDCWSQKRTGATATKVFW